MEDDSLAVVLESHGERKNIFMQQVRMLLCCIYSSRREIRNVGTVRPLSMWMTRWVQKLGCKVGSV